MKIPNNLVPRNFFVILLFISLIAFGVSQVSFKSTIKSPKDNRYAHRSTFLEKCLYKNKSNKTILVRPLTWGTMLHRVRHTKPECKKIPILFIGSRFFLIAPVVLFFLLSWKKKYLWWFIPFLIGVLMLFYIELDIKSGSVFSNPLLDTEKETTSLIKFDQGQRGLGF